MSSSTNNADSNIKVFLRIKPNHEERACLELMQSASTPEVRFCGTAGSEQLFQYDAIGGPECPQEAVFGAVARPMTEQLLTGYNATVFAYGQTGSGKTFTMQGRDGGGEGGLIQAALKYLFRCIEESRQEAEWTENVLRGTFVEIYNETVYDLLADDESTVRVLREDVKRGAVYIEHAREEVLLDCAAALEVFKRGALNRHVAETRMNRESSRSHSIFTLHLQRRRIVNGLEEVLESRFNLVDLAGSERQQSTGTIGVRLKEAGNINKSLLALGNVINALSDSQSSINSSSNSQPKHVHYRDSKLTFLLRDSLGGNSRTAVIACVSPAWSCQGETLSTLRFAKRAKMIQNRAIINQDMRGSVQDLQNEIRRLQEIINSSGSSNKNESYAEESCSGFVKKLLHRLRHSEHAARASIGRNQQLEELLKRREQQLNSERLIIKFRDKVLANLKASLPVEYQHALDEIAELRRLLDSPPELIKVQAENSQLQLRIAELETETCLNDVRYVRGIEEQLANLSDIPMNAIDTRTSQMDTGEDPRIAEYLKQLECLTAELQACKQELAQTLLAASNYKKLALSLEPQLRELSNDKELIAHELSALQSTNNQNLLLLEEHNSQIAKLEFKLINAQQDNEALLSKLEYADNGANLLAELQSAKERVAELSSENAILRHENDKLVQHHNTKQKLQYHVKIKQENNELKTALLAAKEQIAVLFAQLAHQHQS